MTKHEKMYQEAVENIIDTLENGYDGYYCELHHEVFNTDYYIIGTHQAKVSLNEYDVFNAIDLVQTYENDNFGEAYTDLTNPEKLVNMVFYVIGKEVISDLYDCETFDDEWNDQATEENNKIIIEYLKENLLSDDEK